MAVEAERGCGFRKAGGLYLVSDGLGEPCERLPVPIVPCPTCGSKIEFSRSFQWVKTEHALAGAKGCIDDPKHCPRCPVCYPDPNLKQAEPPDRVGLMWVGETFYATPREWNAEAAKLGVSKRIPAVPKELVVGKTWVFVAHLKAIERECEACHGAGGIATPPGRMVCETCKGDGKLYTPAVFHAFRPLRVELIVTPSMKKQRWVKDLEKKHGADLKLVEVPEDDPDHLPVKKDRRSRREKAADRVAKPRAVKEEQGDEKPAPAVENPNQRKLF